MKYLNLIILAILFISCSAPKVGEGEVETNDMEVDEITLSDDQLKTITIDYTGIEEKQISGTLKLNGKVNIDPDFELTVSSVVGGHIQSVKVLPGKFVKRGETLLVIEAPEIIQFQQDYLTTQAQLLSVEPNYNRQKELNQTKATSDKLMQQAETEYKSLLALKSGLEEKLKMININPASLSSGKIQRHVNVVSPFDGVVSEVKVNRGKFVNASDPLLEVINPQGLLLTFKVFEKDLSKLNIGQSIQVFSNSNPSEILNAKVITKGNTINDDGSTEMIAKFTQSKPSEIVNGLFVNGVVTLNNINAKTISEEAVVSYGGLDYIFVKVNKNKFKLVQLKVENKSNGLVQIGNFEQLIGKEIVNKGAYALLMAIKNNDE